MLNDGLPCADTKQGLSSHVWTALPGLKILASYYPEQRLLQMLPGLRDRTKVGERAIRRVRIGKPPLHLQSPVLHGCHDMYKL